MIDKSQVMHFENLIETIDSKYKTALLDAVYMTKRELLDNVHHHAITKLKGKDKRWHTYVLDETKPNKRKEIKRQTEKEIIDYLLSFYELDGMTFVELFQYYLPYKEKNTDSLNTIRRHQQHFNKYFLTGNSCLLGMNIAKIDHLTLQTECNRLVKHYKMTWKEWTNVRGFFFGMFEYAYEMKWIPTNPTERVKITVKFRQESIKTAETEVYKTKEYISLHEYVDSMYEKTGDSAYLAVKLQSYTGVRVGELVALRWEDVNFSTKKITISRQEVNTPYRNSDGEWRDNKDVVDHTKTHLVREIDLLPKAIEVLKQLSAKNQSRSGYIFTRQGERLRARQYSYVLEKYAKLHGKKTKSSHKIRKTYASRLEANKVPLNTIQRDLGHKSLISTQKYIYNPLEDEETYKLKSKAV